MRWQQGANHSIPTHTPEAGFICLTSRHRLSISVIAYPRLGATRRASGSHSRRGATYHSMPSGCTVMPPLPTSATKPSPHRASPHRAIPVGREQSRTGACVEHGQKDVAEEQEHQSQPNNLIESHERRPVFLHLVRKQARARPYHPPDSPAASRIPFVRGRERLALPWGGPSAGNSFVGCSFRGRGQP